jgi:hypothetical protein
MVFARCECKQICIGICHNTVSHVGKNAEEPPELLRLYRGNYKNWTCLVCPRKRTRCQCCKYLYVRVHHTHIHGSCKPAIIPVHVAPTNHKLRSVYLTSYCLKTMPFHLRMIGLNASKSKPQGGRHAPTATCKVSASSRLDFTSRNYGRLPLTCCCCQVNPRFWSPNKTEVHLTLVTRA